MANSARKTIIAALPSENRAALLAIKSAFAFSFGFANAVVLILTGRFATLMTGNTLALAIETRRWMDEEMMLTATLIFLYVLSGAIYDALSISFGCSRVLKVFAIPAIILTGILTDTIQSVTGSCSSESDCSGRHLYFLSPVAFLTGIVTSYQAAHPDGIITNMVTGHMKVLPKSLLTYLLRGNKDGLDKGYTSAAITSLFFAGCLGGSFASDPILASYAKGGFTPVFTVFGCVMAALCSLHYATCDQFCFDYQLEQQLVEDIRATMMVNKKSCRGTSINDIKSMMLAAAAEVSARSVQADREEPAPARSRNTVKFAVGMQDAVAEVSALSVQADREEPTPARSRNRVKFAVGMQDAVAEVSALSVQADREVPTPARSRNTVKFAADIQDVV